MNEETLTDMKCSVTYIKTGNECRSWRRSIILSSYYRSRRVNSMSTESIMVFQARSSATRLVPSESISQLLVARHLPNLVQQALPGRHTGHLFRSILRWQHQLHHHSKCQSTTIHLFRTSNFSCEGNSIVRFVLVVYENEAHASQRDLPFGR